jgi:hypothetical protein
LERVVKVLLRHLNSHGNKVLQVCFFC